MIRHLWVNFLEDVQEYRSSEKYWEACWQQVSQSERERHRWTYPWISTGSPDTLDGNPIFSAASPVLRRGIRIIQHEPTSSKLEIQAWSDFVGGDSTDPASIKELVIACALSSEAARIALHLMSPWVAGRSVSFDLKAGLLVPSEDSDSLESSLEPLEPAP